MLRVESVSFAYGDKKVLSDVGFELAEGEVSSLLGVNGSGKTTLLKIISGLLKPQKGKVIVDNKAIEEIGSQGLSKTVAYMPQKTNGVFCTVFDAVLLGRKPHIGLEVSGHDIETTSRIINMLGLEHYAFKYTTELSGGELQKVVIARALAQEPKILLLDEPISHLDIKNQMEVMRLLVDITKTMNLTTVIVLHDLNMAMRFADKFLLLKDGEVYAYGDRDVVTPQAIRDVYRINVLVAQYMGLSVVIPELS